jgi:hypothetical protein
MRGLVVGGTMKRRRIRGGRRMRSLIPQSAYRNPQSGEVGTAFSSARQEVALDRSNYQVGPINAGGAFTADFALPADLPVDQVVPAIERDRVIMATRPGMRQKHLPILVDQQTGNLLSGGRYLFDTAENAQAYKSWVENEFALDGILFFQRPYFLNPVYYAWDVIGAHDFKDVFTSHTVVRLERWNLPDGNHQSALDEVWPSIRERAEQQGLSSVWLMHNERERLAGIVSVAGRVGPQNPNEPDFASLGALESLPSLGQTFNERGWEKAFDRTSWVLTIWFPVEPGGSDTPALWPNSPPFPSPA